ncbi:type I restriction endonuclease [Streptomyces sparsogenes]
MRQMNRRFDIVLYINGSPLAVLELKRGRPRGRTGLRGPWRLRPDRA